MKTICRVCGDTHSIEMLVCREKMFGLPGEFPYFQCESCHCLQIAVVPADLQYYYPPTYYSYNLRPVELRGLKARLAGLRDYIRLKKAALFSSCLPERASLGHRIAGLGLRALRLKRSMRILDVGCGRGRLLSVLHRAGFRHLWGIDPFLPTDIQVAPGLIIRRQALDTMAQQFDLIMFHHVLEHIADGRKTLECAAKLLSPNGRILIRLPTVDGVAWERYRQNWVNLDAPRHLFLHSRSSLRLLAGQAGLSVERCWCDSGGFQFWGSELYKLDRTLFDQSGRPIVPEEHFTTEQLHRFELEAQSLNRENRGDQLAAILTRAS